MWVEDMEGDLLNLDKCCQIVVLELEPSDGGETHALVADERILNDTERHWLATGPETTIHTLKYDILRKVNENR